MSKRLFRVFPADFVTKLADLDGADLHGVRRDGVTLHGRLLSHDDTNLLIQDHLRRPHTIRLVDIEEIVTDKVAPW
ncbi:MAG: hypothetical protein LH606_14145 [Cytophagaceae bacterium]|nr:hypothetical protein [Cytophagaceae bacterium]